MANTIKMTDTFIPAHARGKIFCPKCAESIEGVRVTENGMVTTKRLLPCAHILRPEQEEFMVQDIFKKGL